MSTPVQRQYQSLKAENPDAVLLFRLGDFYELFFEDALVGSKVLGITLTARHKGTENEMPMCGFPYHAHAEYLETLVEHGYRVAIAEQFEGEDGKIIRKIDRVVSPGTTLESGNLTDDRPNHLVAITAQKGRPLALACVDLSTGDFRTCQLENREAFFEELKRLEPREILCDEDLFADEAWQTDFPQALITPKKSISAKNGQAKLAAHFPPNHLQVAGVEKIDQLISVSAQVLQYLQDTQSSKLENLTQIRRYVPENFMGIDSQTYQHLNIFVPSDPQSPEATLYRTFLPPQTAMGRRTLREFCYRPQLDLETITQRQQVISSLVSAPQLMGELKQTLSEIPDLERVLGRLVNNRGNARDLQAIGRGLEHFTQLQNHVSALNIPEWRTAAQVLGRFASLNETLAAALQEALPLEITQGNMIRPEFDPKLAELSELKTNGQVWLDDFLAQKRVETGMSNLRIKYSKNFGFCLEASKAQATQAPETWVRRQTLVNAERFTTPELSERESQILNADSESMALEHQIFISLRDQTVSQTAELQAAAELIGSLDALLSLARTAVTYNWTQPHISADSQEFSVTNGRHPIVEAQSSVAFIANSLSQSQDNRFHLISGPNMAGKSTFLRQNALILFLGQIGSFVPAEKAEWGLVDQVFTRVGASDNLAAGQSTFFVEMTETARILHQATERSFVILDEIGRGTSTFDGISLAWAITEFLHDQLKAKTLFATHYHELIELADDLSGAKNFHVSVSQNQSGIVFLRQIKPGGMADSFGIEVARLAGIPDLVVSNAREVLARLESENLLSGKLNLFSAPKTIVPAEGLSPQLEKEKNFELEDFISEINPDDLSPKEALEKWYEAKKKL